MSKTASGEMPFLDHLEELRWRLVKCLAAIVVCAVPCAIFWREILDIVMIYPLRFADPKPKIIFTAPAEAILLSIKISIAGGIIIGIPVVFYQIWKFISPGLYKNEKTVVLPVVAVSSACFLLGIGFSYLVLPYVIRFLAGFGGDVLEPFFKANDYISFLIKISLAFGSVFELPVLSFVLTKMGLLTPRFLIRHLRYAIVIMFIFAAVLTPPDIVSQIFLAIPLLVLYGISILVSYCTVRKKES